MREETTDRIAGDELEPSVARRSFLAGGLAGVVASALARLPAAQAQSLVEQAPLLLNVPNVAEGQTALTIPDGIREAALRLENPEGPALEAIGGPNAPGVMTNSVLASAGSFTSTLLANQVTITGTLVAKSAQLADGLVSEAVTADEAFINKRLLAGTALFSQTHVSGTVLANSAVVTQTQGISGAIRGVGQVGVVGAVSQPVTITAPQVGVWGTTQLPLPLTPLTRVPVGVVAQAGPHGIALRALNPDGIAFEAQGRIVVSSGGTGVVPAGERHSVIEDSSLRETCHVNVTLTGDPGNRGAIVQYVESGPGKAVVHLLAKASEDTPFSWLCFEISD